MAPDEDRFDRIGESDTDRPRDRRSQEADTVGPEEESSRRASDERSVAGTEGPFDGVEIPAAFATGAGLDVESLAAADGSDQSDGGDPRRESTGTSGLGREPPRTVDGAVGGVGDDTEPVDPVARDALAGVDVPHQFDDRVGLDVGGDWSDPESTDLPEEFGVWAD